MSRKEERRNWDMGRNQELYSAGACRQASGRGGGSSSFQRMPPGYLQSKAVDKTAR